MLKLTGIALIMVFCSMSGIMLSQRLLCRVKDIGTLISFLKALCSELKYTLATVDELFINLGAREEYYQLDFIYETLDKMNEGESFPNAFVNSVQASRLELDNEDRRILKSISSLLGATDLEGQLKGLQHIEILLNEQLTTARDKHQTHGRIYRTLGTLSGLLIGIILI